MIRSLLLLIFCLMPLSGMAALEAEHYSDYTRILEQGDPALWDEAVTGLVDSNGRLTWKSLSTVLPRIDALSVKTRVLVASGLERRTRDQRAVRALEQMVHDVDPRVRSAAVKSLVKGGGSDVLDALERLKRSEPDQPRDIERRIEQIKRRMSEPDKPPRPVRPPEDPVWRKPLLICFSVLSSVLGVMLFLWGFRLVNLHRLVNGLPRSRISAASMGMTVLRGEAQPYRGSLLIHPLSHEPCLYYPGADLEHPDHRFWIVDGGGRMLVDPRRAVFLSEDGLLVPGEGVQLLGDVQHAKIGDRKRIMIGKRNQDRHHLERLLHFLIQGVLGRAFRDQSSKALFSDPNSCFWIWDDMETKPLNSAEQLQGLFLAFVLTGSWILLLVLGVFYLM